MNHIQIYKHALYNHYKHTQMQFNFKSYQENLITQTSKNMKSFKSLNKKQLTINFFKTINMQSWIQAS